MDATALATAAINALVQFTQGAEPGAAPTEPVYQLVAAKLRATSLGARVLTEFEADPTDLNTRAAATQTLDGEIRRDAQFGEQLHQAMLVASGTGPLPVQPAPAPRVLNPRTRKLVALIGAGVLVLLVGGAFTLVAIDQLSYSPSEVVEDYYAAMKEGKLTDVLALTCKTEQKDTESLLSTAYRTLNDPENKITLEFGEEAATGKFATVQVTMKVASPKGNTIHVVQQKLVDEDGWKVCGATSDSN